MSGQSNDNQNSAGPQNSRPERPNFSPHTSQRMPDILQKAQEHGVFAVCHKQRELTDLVQCLSQAIESMKVAP
jgi:hypothetical protein